MKNKFETLADILAIVVITMALAFIITILSMNRSFNKKLHTKHFNTISKAGIVQYLLPGEEGKVIKVKFNNTIIPPEKEANPNDMYCWVQCEEDKKRYLRFNRPLTAKMGIEIEYRLKKLPK